MSIDTTTVLMTLIELIVAGMAAFIFFELKHMRADLKSELKELRADLGCRVLDEVCKARMQVQDSRIAELERCSCAPKN